jgi:hypothetical protein
MEREDRKFQAELLAA